MASVNEQGGKVIYSGHPGQVVGPKKSLLYKITVTAFFPAFIVILLIITSASVTPTSALGQTGQIGDLQSRSQELDTAYQQALAELVAVDSEVGRFNAEINANSQRLAEVQASIAGEQQRLEETQRQLADRQGFLEKRLRGAYKSDDAGYLEVVMGAGDFSELINRLDMINIIAEDDRQLIDSFKNSKTRVEENLASLSEKQHELAGLLEGLNSSRQNLEAAQARQQGAVASIQSEKEMTDSQISQLQAEAASIESSMSQIQSQSYASGGYSAPPAGGSSFSMTATAYCLGGTTATGMPVGRGVIAVDPGVIPLGSRVHVSGYGDAIAADTGGAIRGNKIDVWLSCGEAYAWGVRSVTVTVY